ncbi:MAG: acyltransferase [Sphingobacteriales bacterium]|nr:MAG: acyltransferase [Sphingobacteriales bacterium]
MRVRCLPQKYLMKKSGRCKVKNIAGKLVWQLQSLFCRVASSWRIHHFRLREGRLHQRSEFGFRTVFNVPIRSGGCGRLLVGSENSFGYVSAPRLGAGEVMLQPREKDAVIRIGNNNQFSNNISIIAASEVVLGNGCLVGDQVSIYDCDFHEVDPVNRTRSVGPVLPVVIGNNVWLGSRVMVLKGVSIGDNTVVGAMSLVTKSLPANCVAAGVPAKVVRYIE